MSIFWQHYWKNKKAPVAFTPKHAFAGIMESEKINNLLQNHRFIIDHRSFNIDFTNVSVKRKS